MDHTKKITFYNIPNSSNFHQQNCLSDIDKKTTNIQVNSYFLFIRMLFSLSQWSNEPIIIVGHPEKIQNMMNNVNLNVQSLEELPKNQFYLFSTSALCDSVSDKNIS